MGFVGTTSIVHRLLQFYIFQGKDLVSTGLVGLARPGGLVVFCGLGCIFVQYFKRANI